MINAGTSFIKTSIVCSSTADNFLSYIFTNKSLLQQEFLNCCKKTLLEHLVSKINCTIFALKEFVDPAQSLLPLCSSAGLAQAVVKEFYAKLEHFIDHSNELGCPVPCTTTSYRHDIQYYSRMRVWAVSVLQQLGDRGENWDPNLRSQQLPISSWWKSGSSDGIFLSLSSSGTHQMSHRQMVAVIAFSIYMNPTRMPVQTLRLGWNQPHSCINGICNFYFPAQIPWSND